MTTHFPSLVRSLMTEHGMSERKLASTAEVNRLTLRRFLSGASTQTPVDHLERVFAVFGYKLDAVAPEPKKEGKTCRLRLRPSAHVVA